MASHEFSDRPGQQDYPLRAWSQQPGLEVDSSKKKGGFSDKQVVTQAYRLDESEDDDRAAMGVNPRQKTSRNPFGLSPAVFGLLVALVTAIVVGAAVGGGVGSQVKSCSA